MRLTLMVAALLGGVGIAQAAGICDRGMGEIGSSEPIRLAEWTFEPVTGGFRFTATMANETGKAVRMIDASLRFKDALDRVIGGISIGTDASIGAGATATETVEAPDYFLDFGRFATLTKGDVQAGICTKAILFADGTRQEF